MRTNRFCLTWFWGLGLLWAVFAGPLWPACSLADDPVVKPKVEPAKPPQKPGEEKPKFPEWDKVVEGAKRLEGLFPLYYNEKEAETLHGDPGRTSTTRRSSCPSPSPAAPG